MDEEQRIESVGGVVLCHDALSSEDRALRLMGHALEVLTASVAVSVAAYAVVRAEPGRCAVGPIVMKVDPSIGDPLALCRRYIEAYAARDPYRAALCERPRTRVVSADGLDGGQSAAAEYLAELGRGPRIWLVFRAADTIIAGVTLSRRSGEPDFTPQELTILQGSHALLEAAHVAALG